MYDVVIYGIEGMGFIMHARNVVGMQDALRLAVEAGDRAEREQYPYTKISIEPVETVTDLTPWVGQSIRIHRTVFGRRWDMGVCHILKAWDGGCMVRKEDGTVSAMATRPEEAVVVELVVAMPEELGIGGDAGATRDADFFLLPGEG